MRHPFLKASVRRSAVFSSLGSIRSQRRGSVEEGEFVCIWSFETIAPELDQTWLDVRFARSKIAVPLRDSLDEFGDGRVEEVQLDRNAVLAGPPAPMIALGSLPHAGLVHDRHIPREE